MPGLFSVYFIHGGLSDGVPTATTKLSTLARLHAEEFGTDFFSEVSGLGIAADLPHPTRYGDHLSLPSNASDSTPAAIKCLSHAPLFTLI